jgi:nitrite reductase/ring-hydroxylating ferredoxin subunit
MPQVKVAAVADGLSLVRAKSLRREGRLLPLFDVDGRSYALGQPVHTYGGPLGRDRLAGNVVTCPLHGSRFDVTSGHVVGPPARSPVQTYPFQVRDGSIFVDVGLIGSICPDGSPVIPIELPGPDPPRG